MPGNIKITQKYCPHCRKTRDVKYFYKSNNLEKFADGYLAECKDCRTRKVDNWNPKTYLDILEECDVPYIPDKWNDLLRRYGKDPTQVTGQTIMGRYLSSVKIKPWNEYRWADTEYLQSIGDEKARAGMQASGYSAAEIDKELRTRMVEAPERPDINYNNISNDNGQQEDYFSMISDASDNTIENDLTEEDKIALRLKWGKTYRPEEWVQLEQFYQEMLLSYDITAAGDINSLKMACKASLKANQLLDIGDKP